MCACWHEQAVARPTFDELRTQLGKMLERATVDYGYMSAVNELHGDPATAYENLNDTTVDL
jgi:hypothetical protein